MDRDNKIEKILDKIESVEEGTILASLFRKIVRELGINPGRFSQLIDVHVNKINVKAKKHAYIKTTFRSQVVNKLISESITWKVFIQGILNVLNIPKMKIHVELYHRNSTKTTHSITVINPNDRSTVDE